MEEKQTSKKGKKEEDDCSDEGGGEDRLTILPDEILCHILSFLGTRCAVKTSVLSRRWRYLWTVVTVLHMDRDEFLTMARFKKFVRHVLKKRDPTADVDKLYFRMHWSADKLITSWPLEYAASHNVNHLTVDFGNHVHLTTADLTKLLRPIPDALLTSCPTLKTLDLSGFRLPESFALTTVTSLHLAACKFPCHSDTFDFSARFPNLEELWLGNCEFLRLKVVKILGSKLLRLHVDRSYLDVQFSRCDFQISASNVTFFSCTWDARHFPVINLPSVKHLLIRFSSLPDERYLADTAKRERGDAFLVFLQGLSTVEFITMSECMLKVLMALPGLERQPSPFSSLKLLKLIADAEDRPVSMPANVKNYLLSGSPCAETAFDTIRPALWSSLLHVGRIDSSPSCPGQCSSGACVW